MTRLWQLIAGSIWERNRSRIRKISTSRMGDSFTESSLSFMMPFEQSSGPGPVSLTRSSSASTAGLSLSEVEYTA
jgi:hypothetical protein